MGEHWPASVRLFIVSFLSLYFELALIRWLPSEIRILAYFTNLTLISCVLGLGIGAIIASRKTLPASLFLVLLAAITIPAKLCAGFGIPGIRMPLASEGYFIWNGLSRIPGTIYQYPVMFGFFIFNSLVFIPIGQMLGKEFERLNSLRAYTINIIGALAGIGVFALFSLSQTPPWVWMACGIAAYLTLVRIDWPVAVATALLLIVSVGMVEPATFWSPYYKITVNDIVVRLPAVARNQGELRVIGTNVTVNQDSHQQAADLSGKYDSLAEWKSRRRIYDEPYAFGKNENVLVLGAGTGNDVAAALRAGARHVDAVEIDPVIYSLGRRLHPEHPYADSRVQVHIRDARTFLRTSGQRYDKIVLGYVDSHALFSAMSSVRLDNFVYTREFFAEMKQHLQPGGILSVTFTVHEKWIADRLFSLMRDTFNAAPVVFQGRATSSSGTVFLGSSQALPVPQFTSFNPAASHDGPTWQYGYERDEGYISPAVFSETTTVPTDNWPYLYLRNKTIPLNYGVCLLVLLLFSYFFVRGATGSSSIRWHFFFLGAGFLVLETKAMTELAIFLGSTWVVNSFVISTVLCLILVANWFISRGWLTSTKTVYCLLIGSLVASYFAPLHALLNWDSSLRNWIAVFVLCVPMFFAGLIFARQLQGEKSTAIALGSNLLGAVLGGMVEYASMALGLKSLYLFAALFYVISYVCLRAPVSSSAPAGKPEAGRAVVGAVAMN
jgi:SAM-dependent methyltransferase